VDLETFGQRIRVLRLKLGLSQKALAKRLGMRESTLSRYENNRRVYQWYNLIKLANALDTSADYILGRTSNSADVHRIISDEEPLSNDLSFFEAYSKLRPNDQNLMRERLLAIYDVRSKDPEQDE
jgi:transcriptional regulator with XRE-family HTH domain